MATLVSRTCCNTKSCLVLNCTFKAAYYRCDIILISDSKSNKEVDDVCEEGWWLTKYNVLALFLKLLFISDV